MKVFELFKPKFSEVTTKDKNAGIMKLAGGPSEAARRRANKQDKDDPTIGNGAYARVEKHPNLPGAVIKYGSTFGGDPAKDGYINFLRELSKNDRMARNPYLPRIHSVKIIDKHDYAVVMEELQAFEDASTAEMTVMGKQAFGDLDAAIRKSLDKEDIIGYEKEVRGVMSGESEIRRNVLATLIANVMHCYIRGEVGADVIADPRLKQALMIVKKMNIYSKGNPDIHASNIMVRRGPYGAQMVLTDPVT